MKICFMFIFVDMFFYVMNCRKFIIIFLVVVYKFLYIYLYVYLCNFNRNIYINSLRRIVDV